MTALAAGRVTIREVGSAADGRAVAGLVTAMFRLFRERNPALLEAIDDYMARQDVEGEIAALVAGGLGAGRACLIAELDGAPVGTLMLKPVAEDICEMNRMFVQEDARGFGIGRALVLELMTVARRLGYTRMRLSSLTTNREALPLYAAMGFEPDPNPDADNPDKDADHVVHLIRDL